VGVQKRRAAERLSNAATQTLADLVGANLLLAATDFGLLRHVMTPLRSEIAPYLVITVYLYHCFLLKLKCY
jgi:hypothetical protein